MRQPKLTFQFDENYKVTVKAEPGVTQADAVKAMRVLSDMRKAVDTLRASLPLNA